jgi:Pectate lyase superfamily protein
MPFTVNVTSPPFNAVEAGVADNTSAIQNAINALSPHGGGTVWIPEGTYLITCTTFHPSNVAIRGCGNNCTVRRNFTSSLEVNHAKLFECRTFTDRTTFGTIT